ncbi:MAG: alpha/beta fold hydrolase [Desulfitobacteriaceae bacterium]
MTYVSVKGTDIYYEGTIGKTLPAVFVHGAGGDSQLWSEQILSLNSQYNVIALDLPGHGKSGGNLLSSINEIAEFIADFGEALSLGKFILVGHSMGGAIAQEFALLYPEKLMGLILIGTGARLRISPELFDNLSEGRMPFSDADYLFGSSVTDCIREEALREMSKVPPAVFLADFKACNNFDKIQAIKEIIVPCLIVVGDEDVMTPIKYAQFLYTNLVNSQLRIIKGAGHMCMMEKPAEVTETIECFLAQLVLTNFLN